MHSFGRHIGSGWCHHVYLDESNREITKVPNWIIRTFMGNPTIGQENWNIIKNYMPSYLLDTSIEAHDKYRYIERRQYLPTMRFLQKSDLKDEKLRRQFSEIIEANNRMHEETGRSLDIFWLEWILTSLIKWEGKKEKNPLLELRLAGYRLIAELMTSRFKKNMDTLEDIGFSNIVILEDPLKRLVITDTTLTNDRTKHPMYRLFSAIVNHGNRIAMEQAFGNEKPSK